MAQGPEMAKVYARGSKLYLDYVGPDGKRRQVASGYVKGQEVLAQKALDVLIQKLSAPPPKADTSTVGAFVDDWSSKRTNKTAADEATRLRKHVPDWIRSKRLEDLEGKDVEKWLAAMSKTGKLAPRTQRHVFDDLRLSLTSAVKDGLIPSNPTDGIEPPRKLDKDPNWRGAAVYELREVEALISDPRIPFVHRTYYALCGLAGLRTGEAAALRWKDIEPREPLDCLWVRSSYSTKRGQVDSLKARRAEEAKPRQVPIHPALGAILDPWWARGWEATFGRAPTKDDLIAPRPLVPGLRRVSRDQEPGGPDVHWRDHAIRDAIRVDCALLGLRDDRGVHDLRASFVTACEEAGCSTLIHWVTHAPEKSVRGGYVRRTPWAPLCEEMTKLEVAEPGTETVTDSVAESVTVSVKPSKPQGKKGWSRRESNPRPKMDSRRTLRV